MVIECIISGNIPKEEKKLYCCNNDLHFIEIKGKENLLLIWVNLALARTAFYEGETRDYLFCRVKPYNRLKGRTLYTFTLKTPQAHLISFNPQAMFVLPFSLKKKKKIKAYRK